MTWELVAQISTLIGVTGVVGTVCVMIMDRFL